MKLKAKLSRSKSFRTLYATIIFSGLALLLSNCFLKQDRTTTIYGTVTDQNGQPVDSILVIVEGVQDFRYDRLKETFSHIDGRYEMVVEVPKHYSSVIVNVPYGKSENPKYMRDYVDFFVSKDGAKTNNCCSASVGRKTKYDFQLIPK
jgi:hypothetical protein